MARIEPVSGEPAAVVEFDVAPETAGADDDHVLCVDASGRALVIADYHAGIEVGLRYERGVELADRAETRRARVLSLLDRTDPDRLVVLGDLAHRIGVPEGTESDELAALIDVVTERVPMTLVRGNHDGGVAEAFGDRIEVTPGDGARLGDVGLLHGHTWPARAVLSTNLVCAAHEHPSVRLTDAVGGSRVERAWLRGRLRLDSFAEHLGIGADALGWRDPELVVFPAFNERSGGTWVNVAGEDFLSPFLPDALVDGEAYLLDGTRLGDYRRV